MAVPTAAPVVATAESPPHLRPVNPLPPTWPWDAPETPVREHDEATGYVAIVCFKHGPPARHGLELEWTVHHRSRPGAPLTLPQIRAALGPHAPQTIDPASPWSPLPRGSHITVEPGGQVEVSTPPSDRLLDLIDIARADTSSVTDILAAADLELGSTGVDAYRPVSRILRTPRYDAMQAYFDGIGPSGARMMCSTASLQVCLDTGERPGLALRWRALHQLGPSLVALFANSPRVNGRATGWASSRLPRVFATAPPTSSPPTYDADPPAAYAKMALQAPVVCIRRQHGSWRAPAGLTFADWISDPRAQEQVGRRPTFADLDYHLTTLFPPVRAHGYLEVRYLDAQPADEWVAPALLLACLMADDEAIDAALDVTDEVADSWLTAARDGLNSPVVARAAAQVADLGLKTVEAAGLGTPLTDEVIDIVQRRLTRPRHTVGHRRTPR